MKKQLLAMVLSLVMTISLTACGQSNDTKDPEATPTASVNENPASSDGNGSTVTVDGEKVTITYANWNLGTVEEDNIERRMVEEFNRMQDKIEVVFAENVDYSNYVSSLTTLAAAGNMPDVIMLSNITEPYMNKWLTDITSIAEADSEWKQIIPSLRESAYVNSKVVAVPFAIHFFGLLVNDDAFAKVNVAELSFNPTLEEFDTAIAQVTRPEDAVVGIKYEGDMINFLPAVMNPDLDYFAFDGDKYVLDGSDFLASIRKAADYRLNGYTWNGLTDSQKANFRATADWEAWSNGEVAVCFDGSYGFGAIGNSIHFNLSYKGMIGGKTIIIPDYFGISASSKHPQEAFEFMKWMSYGKDGFSKRIDIATEKGTAYFSMPITDDREILAKFFNFIPVKGIEQAYEGIDKAIVEPVKIIPGYIGSRWDGLTGLAIGDVDNANIGTIIIKSIMEGLNYADYAKTVNEVANRCYEEAIATMK